MNFGFKRRKIYQQKTIGRIFNEMREKKGISILQAERETQIPSKYLKGIETDNFKIFSAEVYCLNFLRRYAHYLGLSGSGIARQFKEKRNFWNELNKDKMSGPAAKQPLPFLIKPIEDKALLRNIIITPQVLLTIALSVFAVGLLGYIWFQVRSFAAAPILEIKNPDSQIVVSLEEIIVEGKTDPSASLFINNEPIAIDGEGYFKERIKLALGLNGLEIVAKNKAEKETKKTIQVLAKY